jgi:CRISPR/Cas system-associated protein Cas5 (RAMP superfamily)
MAKNYKRKTYRSKRKMVKNKKRNQRTRKYRYKGGDVNHRSCISRSIQSYEDLARDVGTHGINEDDYKNKIYNSCMDEFKQRNNEDEQFKIDCRNEFNEQLKDYPDDVDILKPMREKKEKECVEKKKK